MFSPTETDRPIVRQGDTSRQLAWCGYRCALLLLTGSLLAGCDAPDSAATSTFTVRSERERAEEIAEELHAAVWHRLALMPAVAQTKFVNKRPITDRTRDALLIEEFRTQAHARGIRPEFAERVIRAQIEASKRIQTELYEEWEMTPPADSDTLRDLTQDLRPSIDAVTERMLTALQLLGGCPNEFSRAIEHAYAKRSPLPPQVPDAAWDLAWGPLREIPADFMPGREVLGRMPSVRSTLPENQPLMPEFAPDEL
jgi:chorismate mutase